jgi:hypothetical protein
LSRRSGLNRQNLYRSFAETGNPKFKSLGVILKALGYNITIESVKSEERIAQDVDSTIEKILAKTNLVEIQG